MPFGKDSVHSIVLNWTADFFFDRNNELKEDEMVEIRKKMLNWCTDNIGKNGTDWFHDVFSRGIVIHFKLRPDAMIFKLAWS